MAIKIPTLVIDPEFEALIPPLTEEELSQLESNCLKDGILDPIKIWQGETIVDGHNRYRIAVKHGLPFKTHSLFLKTREEVEDWIDKAQLGRRNLSSEVVGLLRGRLFNRAKGLHGGQRLIGEALGKTASLLAPGLGISRATLERDGAFATAVESLGITQDITSGKLKTSKSKVVETAKSLPFDPTPKQIKKAKAMLTAPSTPPKKPKPEAPLAHVETDSGAIAVMIIEPGTENAGLKAELAELKERFSEQGKMLEETVAENESMGRVMDADDRLKVALKEIKELTKQNSMLLEQFNYHKIVANNLGELCKGKDKRIFALERKLRKLEGKEKGEQVHA